MSSDAVPDHHPALAVAPPAPAVAGGPVELADLTPRSQRSATSRLRRWRGPVLRVGVPALLLLLWQLSHTFGWAETSTLPPPDDVLSTYGELWSGGDLQEALPASLARAGIGLFWGLLIGLTLGVVAGLWALGEEIFDAPVQALRMIPFVALVPLFIIWFGLGEKPKYILIAIATVFPIYLYTYLGARNVDKKLIESAQSFGLSGWRLPARVVLPMALPSILQGVRYSAGIAVMALVVAEQVDTTSGIGFLLNTASMAQRVDIVFAATLIYAFLGIVIDVVLRVVEHVALPWRPRVAIG